MLRPKTVDRRHIPASPARGITFYIREITRKARCVMSICRTAACPDRVMTLLQPPSSYLVNEDTGTRSVMWTGCRKAFFR